MHTGPIRALLLLLGLVSLTGMPYAVLMPIFADKILHSDARGLGLLMGSTGVGALAATLVMAARREVRGLGRWINYASTGFGVSLILFSFSRSLPLSIALLLPAGFCMLIQMASSNTLIQTMVPDALRGRVMSVYSMMFMGMAPFGALLAGAIATASRRAPDRGAGRRGLHHGFAGVRIEMAGHARRSAPAHRGPGHEKRRTSGRDERPSGRSRRPQTHRTGKRSGE